MRPASNQYPSGLQHPVELFAAHTPCLFSVCDECITGEVKEAAATGTLVEPVSGFQGSWAEQRAELYFHKSVSFVACHG